MPSSTPLLLLCAAWACAFVACGSNDDPPAHLVPGLGSGPTHDAGVGGAAPSVADSGTAPAPGPISVPPSGLVMGATVVDGGTEFRVWAPHANQVAVSGDFASGAPTMLAPESKGLFATTVADAKAGQRYRFTLTTNGQTFSRFDPRARATSGRNGDAIIVDPRTYAWKSAAFSTPAPNEAVIYEMYVPAFNVAAGTPYGTFVSAIDKLDHLQALGVNLIELMPSAQYGSDVSWGYNPLAYYAPHAPYGTPDDLRRFVDEAHARGIGVLLDAVYNHYDDQHTGLWCFDGACPNDSGIYFFSDPAYARTPWGPRPDYSKKEVVDFLVDGLFVWLSEYRFDGFRWDSAINIHSVSGAGTVPGGRAFMAHANDTLHGLFPRALFIAEDYRGDASMTAQTSAGGVGFDAQWDGLNNAVNAIVTQPSDAARDVNAVRNVIDYNYNHVGTHRVIFTENHDIAGNGSTRLPAQIDAANPKSWRARKESILAAAVAVTSPGIPMLLQGQELLESAAWSVNHTPPIDWNDATVNAPIVAFYTDLLHLRRNLGGVSAGLLGQNVNVFHVNTTAKVLGWQRWGTPGDDVVIVANFSGTPFPSYAVGLPKAGVWHVRLNSDSKKYSADFADTPSPDVSATPSNRDGLPATGLLNLAPYSIVALSQ